MSLSLKPRAVTERQLEVLIVAPRQPYQYLSLAPADSAISFVEITRSHSYQDSGFHNAVRRKEEIEI
jgi:hypothetical protein